ncbi:hypothetical protein MYAM1_000408 [Malassezia yamatoensis]|uniref:Bicarbonate transporter-like transmembrane domain-containing protein n=1 Tax=Malassezia yamatoensis TaxID=253288 RepID=A0AAJ5YWJ0_9BASI|nr:hypothetical protein MYAM1_000408 [Malassezia yamatoensis]
MLGGSSGRREPSSWRVSRRDSGRKREDAEKDLALSTDERGNLPWEARSIWYEFRPFRGMIADVRRRLPYYKSDWLDGLRASNIPTISVSVIQIFFINLMPAIAYVLDMYDRTDGSYGVNEVILASALAAIVFSVFSAQPLTFVGVTGLTNLVNYTVYDIAHNDYGMNREEYLRVQCWMMIWAAGFHFLIAIFNICDYTRFITEMICDTFGLYVGVIYIQKGIELLVREFGPVPLSNATGWLAVTIALLFCFTVYFATMIGTSIYLPFHLRRLIGGFAFAAGCVFWTGFSNFPGHSLKDVPISRLPITKSFFPTLDRSWVIDFWHAELRWIFAGAPLGFLLTLLFYFDHNVSSIMAQSRKFPITKPAGFHWDFFLLGCTTLVSGILGLPVPNGLVPQAPYHTDSLAIYKQDSVHDEEQDREKPIFNQKNASILYISYFPKLRITRVIQQRLSHFIIGLLTVGSMTRPILVALGTMPRAVFAGVFLVVGWSSIEANPILLRTVSLLRDRSAIPIPLNARPQLFKLRRRTIALFVAIQWLFFGMTVAISQTIAAIGFPVIIILMIPCRVYCIPHLFKPDELEVLDAQTASAPAVMCSLGTSSKHVPKTGDSELLAYESSKVRQISSSTSVQRSNSSSSPILRTPSASNTAPAESLAESLRHQSGTPPSQSADSSPITHLPEPSQVRLSATVSRSNSTATNAGKSSFIENFQLPTRSSSQRSKVSTTSKPPKNLRQDDELASRSAEQSQLSAIQEEREKTRRESLRSGVENNETQAAKDNQALPSSKSSGGRQAVFFREKRRSEADDNQGNDPLNVRTRRDKNNSKNASDHRSKRIRTIRRHDKDDSSEDEVGTEYVRNENPPRGRGKGVPAVQAWSRSSRFFA